MRNKKQNKKAEEKKKVKTSWYTFVKSSPGKIRAFIILLLKSQHLKFDQI